MTLSVASMGQGDISFFETPIGLLPLTTLALRSADGLDTWGIRGAGVNCFIAR